MLDYTMCLLYYRPAAVWIATVTDGGQNGFKRSKQARLQEAGGVARAGMSLWTILTRVI